jgi:sigma-B regulation protein RsbU (phosphoserine phosphatase)
MAREVFEPPQTESGSLDHVRALERTLDSLREDSQTAHVLLALSAALAEVRTVEETLELSVTMVPRLLGAERCFAASWDDVNDRYTVRARTGYDDSQASVLEELAQQRGGLPLVRHVLEERAPLLVEDVTRDRRIPLEQARRRQLGAWVGIPLLRWGEELGVLGIEYSQPRRFGAQDSALAQGIARQVGVAMANARRFNLLKGLRTIGLRTGSQLGLAGVIKEVVAGAVELLAGDAGVVYFLDAERLSLVASESQGLSAKAAEAMARIDVQREPWSALAGGHAIHIPDLPAALGRDEAPASAIAAPIHGSETPMLGVAVVLFRHSVALGPDETEALSVLTAQASTAIENAQRFERQRRVARSLQAGLLSTEMPDLADCEVGAVYETARRDSEVGGDFFDVFEVRPPRAAFVVGDVSGKGADAAAQSAMARFMLRAFAMRNPAPSSVLFHLNNALVQGLGEDRFTTALYGLLDCESRECQIALGGHPPPLLYRRASKEIESFELKGSIIGAFEDQQYESRSVTLQSGDVLLVYTDGLVEARSNDELYGRHRIVESLRKHAPDLGGQDLARVIYEDAAEFGVVGDDTVVFALSCRA